MIDEKDLLNFINKSKKKTKNFNKKIVILVIFLNTAFAWSVLYVFLKTGSEPVVLIGSWFAFTVGELWLLSGIKKAEINKEEDVYDGFNQQ